MKKLTAVLVAVFLAGLVFASSAHAYLHEATARARTVNWTHSKGYFNVRVPDCIRRSSLTVDCLANFDVYWGQRCAYVVRVTPNLTRGIAGECTWHTSPNYWA